MFAGAFLDASEQLPIMTESAPAAKRLGEVAEHLMPPSAMKAHPTRGPRARIR
jgi:hypothetical protein